MRSSTVASLKFLAFSILFLATIGVLQDKEKISFEKIIIDRTKYHLQSIDMLIQTFSRVFENFKNIDILKYGICKYLLPRYLFTNSLQLLLHQAVLNLEKKCPECMLRFYRNIKETPKDFQSIAKIFNFAEKFADYKLKIQAFQTFLQEVELYSQEIMKIYLENNRGKLLDYIRMLEEQIIGIFTESFMK